MSLFMQKATVPNIIGSGVNTKMTPFHRYLFDLLDSWANDYAPHGVAVSAIETQLTTLAFDHYLATYGLPTNANEMRHMFEWASLLHAAATELEETFHGNT